jgi:hypothetical protein
MFIVGKSSFVAVPVCNNIVAASVKVGKSNGDMASNAFNSWNIVLAFCADPVTTSRPTLIVPIWL